MNDESKQRLTDEDIDRIVDKACERLEQHLYHNIGKGVASWLLRALALGALALAAYGAGAFHWFK